MWTICIDTGGTFTDCVAQNPSGNFYLTKVLSNSSLRARFFKFSQNRQTLIFKKTWSVPKGFITGFRVRKLGDSSDGIFITDHPEPSVVCLEKPVKNLVPGDSLEFISPWEAPILAARMVTGTIAQNPLPPLELRLATTKGTNALLEKKGSSVTLLTTRGFKDLLAIGDQRRPNLFDIDIIKPKSLASSIIEIDEHTDAQGISQYFSVSPEKLAKIKSTCNSAVAICLKNSYANPENEKRLAKLLSEQGINRISRSSELSQQIRYLPRMMTATVNAFLSGTMEDYLNNVEDELPQSSFKVMNSAGGLIPKNLIFAKDTLLSGPAGGVVGAAGAGAAAGVPAIISFDMGGTSTDVSRCLNEPELVQSHKVGDAELMTPALKIETVAAGGGSICGFRLGQLTVGPESAGAFPGPACYGAGGPLTITDVNLLLGRMDASEFGIPVYPEKSLQQLKKILKTIKQSNEPLPSPQKLLQGFLDIANRKMADAIESVSVREGYPPAKYTMLAFGGAGGQHALAIADQLAIKRVIFPALAGVLSAWGLSCATSETIVQKQFLVPLAEQREELPTILRQLKEEAISKLRQDVLNTETVILRTEADLRLSGQDHWLTVPAEPDNLESDFQIRYQKIFGYTPPTQNLEREPDSL